MLLSNNVIATKQETRPTAYPRWITSIINLKTKQYHFLFREHVDTAFSSRTNSSVEIIQSSLVANLCLVRSWTAVTPLPTNQKLDCSWWTADSWLQSLPSASPFRIRSWIAIVKLQILDCSHPTLEYEMDYTPLRPPDTLRIRKPSNFK